MANRIINAVVSGETIKLSNKIAGAAGSCNAVSLALSFDGMWDGTTKKVYFFDVNGGNAVVKVLTADLLTDGAYLVPIPAEPIQYAGEMTLTIKGVELGADGVTAERVMMSATTTMKVLNAETPSSDTAPVEPNATQTEQLQAEIDTLTSSIESIPTNVAAAATSAANAASSATNAAASAASAAQSATSAAGSATTASTKATAASGSATAAANSATDADASKTAAASSASGAAASESNAAASANIATAKAAAAAASEANALIYKNAAETAKTDAINAKDAAITAKTAAETAKTAAETAQGAAETAQAGAETAQSAAETAEANATAKATLSQSYAIGGTGTRSGEDTDNAKYYKEQAAAIVGGDYPTKTEAQGYVDTHDASGTAHATLFGNKVDKVAGKGLSTKDYTSAEKTKLSGIEASANNYVHPTTSGNKHIPSGGSSGQVLKYSADGTAVWGTDNDTITTINGNTGAIAKTDIVALGIPAQDTVYTHPANHAPSIITQDANNRFVSDTEKSTWNGKANSSHTHTKSQITDFPTTMTPLAHKASHSTGGADALTAGDIGAAAANDNLVQYANSILSTLGGATVDTGTKIATGSYTGTGTNGSSNPNSLTFAFPPKLVFVGFKNPGGNSGTSMIFMHGSTVYASGAMPYGTSVISVNYKFVGNTVSWYADDYAKQNNVSNKTYYYVAIG